MAKNESQHRQEVSERWKMFENSKGETMLPIGIAGALGMLAWGRYSYRYKGDMPAQMFLIHLRLKTHSMIVGALTFGVTYSLLKKYATQSPDHRDEQGHLHHVTHDDERRMERLRKK